MNVEINVSPATRERGRVPKTIVYFSHKGESIMDNLINRRSRPRDLYATYLPDVAEKLGLARAHKFRWSQKAGCPCGCSPGFICEGQRGQVVWVELTEDAPRIAEGDTEAVAIMQARSMNVMADPSLVGPLIEAGIITAPEKRAAAVTMPNMIEQ